MHHFLNSIKKHKILSAMIAIIIILFAWWAFVNLTPKPLGDKMEYLGKEDYGCWVGFCDARPYSVYYYGTDMSEEEITRYFKSATYNQESDGGVVGEGYSANTLRFTSSKGAFSLDYYNNNSAFETSRKRKTHTISLTDTNYDIAKQHLK